MIGTFAVAGESAWRRKQLLILCYHGISLRDEHRWWPHLYITPEQFRERLRLLSEARATVLPLGEGLRRLREGSLPPRSVVITFDDGFADFHQHAFPALRDFGFPCTLYLTTHYCGRPLPIINLVLDYVLWKSGKSHTAAPVFDVPESLPLSTFEERQVVVKRILDWMLRRELSTGAKDDVARELAGGLGVNYDSILGERLFQIMTPEEVRQTAQPGIGIELHTHCHRVPRDRALFEQEIKENRRRIIELVGKAPVHFCYPSGEYAPEFFGWLGELGVQSATTCEMGLAARRSQSMRLPRVLDDSGMSTLRFQSVIAGLLV